MRGGICRIGGFGGFFGFVIPIVAIWLLGRLLQKDA